MSIDLPLYNPYPTMLQRRGAGHLDGFVSLCDLGDGSYLMSYQHGGAEETDPSANTIVMRRSTDGVNWSLPEIAHSEVPTYAVKGSNLTLLSDGTLLLVYNRTSGPPTVREGFFFLSSDDDGETWDGPTEITTSIGSSAQGAPIVELSGGTLIAGFWDVSGGAYDARAVFSSDGGETWGSEVTIADGSADERNYAEPNILELASGDLLCLIRCTSDSKIYQSTSEDNGATWSAPAEAFEGEASPRMVQLSDDTIVCINRGDAAFHGWPSPFIITSSDDGATWSSPQELDYDDGSETYGDIVELSGSRVGLGFGVRFGANEGTIHYKIMDFGDLP